MTSVDFLTVGQFKAQVASATATLEVLRNKATEKLFMAIDGQNYKVQQDIDSNAPIKVLVPLVDGKRDYENACLVNVDETKGADSIFTL